MVLSEQLRFMLEFRIVIFSVLICLFKCLITFSKSCSRPTVFSLIPVGGTPYGFMSSSFLSIESVMNYIIFFSSSF